MEIIIGAIIVSYTLYIISKNKNNHGTEKYIDEKLDYKISEEDVIKAQIHFEEQFEYTYCPDGLSGSQIYLYKEMMLPWYNELISEYRYDEDKKNKIMKDFVLYTGSILDGNTESYLSLELEDLEERENYSKEARESFVIAETIETAFAKMIGEKAEKKLNKTRSNSPWGFTEKGELKKTKDR